MRFKNEDALVGAFLRSSHKLGRAEAAGVRVGDELLGVGERYFEESTSLTTLVQQIKSAEEDVVLLLRRGGEKAASRHSWHFLIFVNVF